MAKINGTCKGTSAAKYDLWLDVKQNSQNIENNTSNVTVQLKLQRNDGYASSAYNLNESDNSAALKIDGEVKDSGTLKIDTRNSVTVVLAEWTGNVKHSDDGTLSFPISGSFTMGNTSLTGGSVSGSFKCTNIPRASTLTLGDSSVTPGGSFTFGISGVSSFKHKITCQIGSEVKQTNEFAAGTLAGNITIPQSWANYVADAKKTSITITLATYKSSKLIGSKRYSISFTIPNTSAYKPSFEISLFENGAPNGWGVYLKGVSKITVKLENIEYKYGASLKSISIKFDGSTKHANNSVFEVLNAGEKTVVVRLTDSRGYYSEIFETVTVKNYFPPSIKINSVVRCNEQGVSASDGTYLLLSYTSRCCDVKKDDISLNNSTIKYSLREKGEATAEVKAVTEDSPLIIGEGAILSQIGYEIVMTIADGVTKDDDTFSLGTAGIPFNIKSGGLGAAFGCYAENDNELRIAWDLNVLGKLAYEKVTVNIPETISNIYSLTRYYSCLDLVILRLRLTVAETLEASKDHVVAIIQNYPTGLFTPLSVRVNYNNGRVVTGGMKFGAGEISIRSDEIINPGDYIYISGMYWVDYESTE